MKTHEKPRFSRINALKSIGVILLIVYVATFVRHQTKELPEQLNYESETYPVHDEEIQFLADITINAEDDEPVMEHEIFTAFHAAILNAERFLVLDMFLFSDLGASEGDFPSISKDLERVILHQMEQYPELNVWIITDHINTSYGSHRAANIEVLEEQGAEVVYAALGPLRDPVPVYSSFYRMFFQWLGYEGKGWVTNPFGGEEPKVSLRSYLKMLNTKGNHRKVLITENVGIYTSANAHDPSGPNSNIGVRLEGALLEALLEAERRVVIYTRGNDENFPTLDQLIIEEPSGEGDLKAKVITEGKIFIEALKIINEAMAGEALWLGMYLLSDPDIVEALESAAERSVAVRMILDPNQKSFGREKPGIPNIAVTHRIAPEGKEHLEIRWYNVNEEQYHSKILFLDGRESMVLLGSTNFTKRSFQKNNLENNLLITTSENTAFMKDVRDYFHRLWNNADHEYTMDFEEYQDGLSWFRRILFRIQKTLRLTSF